MKDLSVESDKVLIARLQDGEVHAFDTLFYKYSQKLYRFSISLLKNEEDSREIIQETFLRVWKKRNDIDSAKSFKSFLFTISYNLIIDQLRLRIKDQEFRKNFLNNFSHLTTASNIENSINYTELDNQVKVVINGLPEKRRNIYRLSREEGLSYKQIAKKFNISEKTVENQINLSLRQIREKLGDEFLGILLFIALFA